MAARGLEKAATLAGHQGSSLSIPWLLTPLTKVLRDPGPSSGLHKFQAHTWYTNIPITVKQFLKLIETHTILN
jgi:hypothetical protein